MKTRIRSISDVESQKLEYPCLKVFNDLGFYVVVLFCCPAAGTVVCTDNPRQYKIGEYKIDWSESVFKAFSPGDVVTLQNTYD